MFCLSFGVICLSVSAAVLMQVKATRYSSILRPGWTLTTKISSALMEVGINLILSLFDLAKIVGSFGNFFLIFHF